ncbi:MAG TPA: hypothetical protein VFF03_08185 [Rhodocyclaceae bacterium]|nr:hypothetical protein [Rhodocyclaceae bacterium]
MGNKPKYLQPAMENRQCQGRECVVTTYPLSEGDPEEGAWDLREGLNGWGKEKSDLFVLDIAKGEPVWLKWVLDRMVGFGAPVIIVPKAKARNATLMALKAARSPNTDAVARDCGFEA